MNQLNDVTTSLSALYLEFRVAIIASLIGAIIGHFKSNGYIQMPTVIIDYEKTIICKEDSPILLKFLNWLICPFEIALFLVGIRFGENKEKGAIFIELGFIGDMLVGIGAGILAKAALSLAATTNGYSVISTSLLAGFGGLSYIQSQQTKSLNQDKDNYQQKLEAVTTEEYPVKKAVGE
ncbi:hypothetical protein [Bacillus thuringiensis]|uniref:hypothetical protein n=1 Tax=Bacillus thuringiensis TaxID=1428 RepID=UPI000BFB8279|nr:hypothetical protein [Bacillus thuringiensis]PGP33850.1 hypothetical protein COA06_32360 [Bacillus thuringiensis]